jgi:hypothetical protein
MRHAVLTMAAILTSALFSIPSLAQTSALGTRVSDYGGFVGLDLRFGDIASKFAAFAGAEAAVLLKRRVYLGIRGGGLATDNSRIPSGGSAPDETLAMGYGGFLVGYMFPTRSLAEFSLDVLVGGGGVGAAAAGEERDWDGVFVFEPSATLDLKLAPVVRVGIGAGYRFIGDLDVPGLRDTQIRGFTGLIRMRVGKF